MNEEIKRKKLLSQMDSFIEQLSHEIPFDANDLPGFAGKLFDFHQEHPQLLQIDEWRRRSDLEYPPFAKKIVHDIYKKIEVAQDSGIIPKKFSPADLFSLIVKISAIGSSNIPEEVISERAKSRKLVIKSVEHLVK